MPQIPSRFVDIVQQLKENKQPRRATVRSVLKWFNAARRGANVVGEIEKALKLFAFVNRLQFYAGNLKRFLNDYMASYAPSNPELIKAQANIFRQTVQNIYIVFGANAARLYSIDAKSNGSWDSKFSVAALDIQAGALVGKPTAKVQATAEQIREQYLYCLLTDDVLQSAISKQTGGTTQTKYRWNTFKTIVEPIIATGQSWSLDSST